MTLYSNSSHTLDAADPRQSTHAARLRSRALIATSLVGPLVANPSTLRFVSDSSSPSHAFHLLSELRVQRQAAPKVPLVERSMDNPMDRLG